MVIKLKSHQKEALGKLHSGVILYGGVGSGKTYTALFFYKEKIKNKKLYVITTAQKRDLKDWENEANSIGIYDINVDSWNNIKNYKDVSDSFFVFDEQRSVGYGTWSKNMIAIANKNQWIMLTATPGDRWIDYMSIFIANGWYKNKTDFINQHVEYDPWVKFPKIKKYHNIPKLKMLRDRVLIPMTIDRHTTRHRKYLKSEHDKELYLKVMNDRWHVLENRPIENVSELTHLLRKLSNTNNDRIRQVKFLADIHDKAIIFYNFDYELEILRDLCIQLGKDFGEWNGHYHDPIPDSEEWLYLVQYTAGAEGWNCIDTNIIIFYSLNYSFRTMEQAEGRIDRMNTPFEDLEYFYLLSEAPIDKSILQAIKSKKKFNESAWAKRSGYRE